MGFTLLGILNSQAAGGVDEPAFLTSAPLWLDAADASTITASSGSVSQWDNKGTLENFVQATSANQPTTGTQTLNGLNVLDFASEFMTGQTLSNWKFMHDGTDYFIAMVVKPGNTADPDTFFGLLANEGGGSANVGFSTTFADRSDAAAGPENNAVGYSVRRGVAATGAVSILQNNFFIANEFSISSALLDPNDSVAANRIDYFINDTEGSVNNTLTDAVSTANPSFDLTLGALDPSGTLSFIGQIGEVIVVRGADATESNRQEVVEYLNAKWSVFS